MARTKNIVSSVTDSNISFDPDKHLLAGKIDLSFNKTKDIRRVEPARVLLISEMLASGVVPSDSSDLEYNDIDDPDNVEGTVRNVFDAIDKQRELASLGKKVMETSESTLPSETTNNLDSNSQP